jgi:hypothetical protein
MPRPFSANGRVATTHSSIRFCATMWSFHPRAGKTRIAATSGSIKWMMGLKSANQNARVYQHALGAVWIDALAACGLL